MLIKFNKYKFRKYSKSFPIFFNKEKQKLKYLFPKNTKIEHVGSTAVPGLSGKGMVDLAIAVPKKKMPYYQKILENLKFIYKQRPLDNERLFFEKSIVYRGKERKVALHLTDEKSSMWQEFIVIRDALRNNKSLAREYEKIKKKALKFAKGSGKKYLAYKQPFLRNVLKKYSNSSYKD